MRIKSDGDNIVVKFEEIDNTRFLDGFIMHKPCKHSENICPFSTGTNCGQAAGSLEETFIDNLKACPLEKKRKFKVVKPLKQENVFGL
jgi:hypothetical protein